MPAKKHIELIDILKGIAILSVILSHAVIVFPINLEAVPWCNTMKNFVGCYQMPLFFIISGYLCSYHNTQYGAYLLARTKRLLVPYALFSCLAIFFRIVGSSVVNSKIDLKSAVFELFLQGNASSTYWFLYTLFILSAIAPLLIKLVDKSPAYGLLLMAVCIVVSTCVQLPYICALGNVVYHGAYYLIGILLKRVSFQNFCSKKRLALLAGVSGAIWLLTFFGLQPLSESIYNTVGKYVTALSGSAFLAAFFSLVKLPKFIKAPLIFSGKYSLQFYVLNGFLMTAARWLLVTKLGITSPAWVVLCIFLFCSLCAAPISKIMDSNNLFRFLCGLKVRKKA